MNDKHFKINADEETIKEALYNVFQSYIKGDEIEKKDFVDHMFNTLNDKGVFDKSEKKSKKSYSRIYDECVKESIEKIVKKEEENRKNYDEEYKMNHIPKIIYNETNESDATEVEKILKKIYSLQGERLSKQTQLKFESYLDCLLDYVTLIGCDIMEAYYSTERHRIEPQLAYFYNEDMVKILGLQLMVDNMFTNPLDIPEYQDKLKSYKLDCMKNNRCVVYDMDDMGGDVVFKLNPEMSNLNYMFSLEHITMRVDCEEK